MTPSIDISKFFSSDGRTFDITRCASDLGCITPWSDEYAYGKEDFQVEMNQFQRWPGQFFSLITDANDASESILYIWVTLDDNPSQLEFGLCQYNPFFQLQNGRYDNDKNILLIGCPRNAVDKKVYVNEAILNTFVWCLEQLGRCDNNEDLYNIFHLTIENDLLKKDVDNLIPRLMTFNTDLTQYYSPDGGDFNIIQCAADLGYDTAKTKTSIVDENQRSITLYYPNSDGSFWSVQYIYKYYFREKADPWDQEWFLDHSLTVYYIPSETQPLPTGYEEKKNGYLSANLSTKFTIILTGFADDDDSVFKLSHDSISTFVWLLERIAKAPGYGEVSAFGDTIRYIYYVDKEHQLYNAYYLPVQ